MGWWEESREEHQERYNASVSRFKSGEISEADLRLSLGFLGYNATDIEAEIAQCKQELEEGG